MHPSSRLITGPGQDPGAFVQGPGYLVMYVAYTERTDCASLASGNRPRWIAILKFSGGHDYHHLLLLLLLFQLLP